MSLVVEIEREHGKLDQFRRLPKKVDESFRQCWRICTNNWTVLDLSNSLFCIEKMYFKKEHVERAKRTKQKLKTEISYDRPESNSVNLNSINGSKRKQVITYERPKLLYSLLAPPYLSSEKAFLELRDLPTRPEKRQEEAFSFVLKMNTLSFEVPNSEDLSCSISIYDLKEKKKVTENFNFKMSDIAKGNVNAVFQLEKNKDEHVIVMKLDKSLQGDKFDPMEAYQIETPEKNILAIREYMKINETILSKYKMQFLWTFVAFAGLKNKILNTRNNTSESLEMSTSLKEGSLIVEDDCSKNDFRPKKGTIDFNINQVFRMDNDKLSDEKICSQIVEVCKNPKAFDKRSISCNFSISIGSGENLFNIKTDDHYKSQPWNEEIADINGTYVREFPSPKHVPKPFLDLRNIIYISPKCLNFSCHSRARNICIKIEIKNETEATPSIIEPDGNQARCSYTSVTYHKSAPYFIDETKVELPTNLSPDHHIFFTFYHISVKEGRESVIGYSWLPLLDANQQILNNTISLPVCMHPPPNGYGRVGPDVNLPGVKWFDNRKLLFTVDVKVDSTIHITDKYVHIFAKQLSALRNLKRCPSSFCTIAGKRIPTSQLSESLCYAIRNVASLSDIREVIHHLYLVIDGLLYLIVCPPEFDRIIIAQCAFSTLVDLVNKIHKDQPMQADNNGRNIELEKFVYFMDALNRTTDNVETDYEGSMARKNWIRHTMTSRKKKLTNISRHSSYTESPTLLRYNQSTSDSNIETIEKKKKEVNVNSNRADQKLLHEELILQIVVCRNLKEIMLRHIWFYLELISKSITQEYLETKNHISERCFEDLLRLSEIVINEINQKHMTDPENATALNSFYAFFLRDLIGILSNKEVIELVNLYSKLTSESIHVNPNLNALKLSRARFIRLLLFHQNFVQVLLSDKGSELDAILNIIFCDLELLVSTFDVDMISLDYHLNTIIKFQSGIDADARYDLHRDKVAKLFLPLINISFKYLNSFNCDETKNTDKLSFFTTSLLLMTNVWILRTIDKPTLKNFIRKTAQLKHFMTIIFLCVNLFKYKPEAVLFREKKRNNQSKQNLDMLSELNKLQAGSAISMLRKNQSLPRSTSLIESGVSNNNSSVRSWKQVKTRGLTNTLQTDGDTLKSKSLSNVVLMETPAESVINVDIDLSTEVTHTVLDILEEISVLQTGYNWQYEFGLILVELISAPQSSVCALLRTLKILRNVLPVLLNVLTKTPLLSVFCLRIPILMASGNLDVSKAAQLTVIKLMKETFVLYGHIGVPSYWITYGVTIALGLFSAEDYATIKTNRLGNLQYHLQESLIDENQDNEEFFRVYKYFAQNILTLVNLCYKNIKHMVKTKAPSTWLLTGIAECLKLNPIHRMNTLQCLSIQQKKHNPIEAGMCYLHQAAIICEVLHYSPSYGTEHTPQSAAILSNLMQMEDLVNEAFQADWANKVSAISLKSPSKLTVNLESDLKLDVYLDERDCRFSLEGLETVLRHAEKCFTSGKISELSSLSLQVLLKLADNSLEKMRNITSLLQQAHTDALDQHAKFGSERFGSYFRVKFYGKQFPDEVANKEFIFREAMAAKLSEVSDKVKKEAEYLSDSKVHLLKTALAPYTDDNEFTPAIHLTFVKTCWHDWEDGNSTLKKLNLKNFCYSTPFTATGLAHGSIKTQQKRKTYLKVKERLPSFVGWSEVIQEQFEILNPIQVAKEDIHYKTVSLYESLKSDDTRIIQLLLQGAIQTQVNQGPLQMAQELLTDIPDDAKMFAEWDDLRISFINFLHIVKCAISRNQQLIDVDRHDYHRSLEENFVQIQKQLIPLLRPQNTYI